MSTRGAVGFQLNNIIKATYNHSDSYPGGLGCDIAHFLAGLQPGELEMLKQQVSQLRWVKEEETPTSEDKRRFAQFADLERSGKIPDNWYCLLRQVQGVNSLPHILAGKLTVLIDSTEFLQDSLFCEWAYIINFDDNSLDTYEGFQKKSDSTNPLGCKKYGSYYPCKRIFQLALTQLVSSDQWFKRFKLATKYREY